MRLVRLVTILAVLLFPVHAAASQQTKDQLETNITTNLPSSGAGAITAAILRQVLQDIVDSMQQILLTNDQTGTTYTFLTSDAGQVVTFSNASPVAVTLPAANGDFAGGYNTLAQNIGDGLVTITVSAGNICNLDSCGSTLELEKGEIALLASAGGNVYRALKTSSRLSPLADDISSTQGTMLYRDASEWQALEPGSAGQTLTTSGAGANPFWSAAGTGTVNSVTCGTGLSGGTITLSGTCAIANQISANTFGAENEALTITVNDQGQLTNVVSQTISAVSGAAILDSSKTGTAGANLVTGTAGTDGDLMQWSGGDAVDGPTPPSGDIVGTTDSQVLTSKTMSGSANTFSGIALEALESISTGQLLANVSGSTSPASGNSWSDVADTVSDQQGTILYRGSGGWLALEPGTAGQVLATSGISADPEWVASAGGGTVTSITIGDGLDSSGSPITASGTISANLASQSEYFGATSNAVLDANTVYTSEITVSYSTSVDFDLDTFINGTVTLTGDIQSMTFSNVKAGQAGTIAFVQDATGGRTISAYASELKFAGGTEPTLTTSGTAVDILSYYCRTSSFCAASLLSDVK